MTETGTTTRARSILIQNVTEEDAAKWADLAERSLEPNPFFHPGYLLTSRRWFDTVDGLRLIVVEKGDRWIAMLPLSAMGRFRNTPLHYASTAGPFVGRRASLCAPLVDAVDSTEACDALLSHLRSRHSTLPGLVELTLLPADGGLYDALLGSCRRLRIPAQERSRFARAYARVDDYSPSNHHLSASRRKQSARHERNLMRTAAGPLEFTDLGADADAITAQLDLEAAGWKGRKGSALKMKPGLAEWFSAVTDDFRARDALHVYALRAGEATVYMSTVIRSGSVCFGILDSYDEEYARHSPGSIGRLHELTHIQQLDGMTAFDACLHPKHDAATALYPHRREMVSVLIAARGPSRLMVRFRPLARRIRRTSARIIGYARHIVGRRGRSA